MQRMCLKTGGVFDIKCGYCNPNLCYQCNQHFQPNNLSSKNGHNYCYNCDISHIPPPSYTAQATSPTFRPVVVTSHVVEKQSLNQNQENQENQGNRPQPSPALRSLQTTQCTLINDIMGLLTDHSFSDVTFLVGGKKIAAHRAILAARSPVFAKMFQEKINENQFVLKDMDFKVMQELLKFIYSGNVNNLKDLAPELLDAAHNFELTQLKGFCLDYMTHNLSIDTAIPILTRAAAYDLQDLKLMTLTYMKKNLAELTKHPQWINFVKNKPELLTEIVLTQ